MASGRNPLDVRQSIEQCRESSRRRNRRAQALLIETDALISASEDRLARSRDALARLGERPARPGKKKPRKRA